MNANSNPDRLRQVLRQGDPAAQEPGLTADEVHAMRRAVLAAIPEPRRQVLGLLGFPGVALATAAALVLALAVAFGPWHRTPAPSRPAPVRVAAVPNPAVTPSVPPATAPVPVKTSRPAHRRPVRALKSLPVRQDDAPLLRASLPVREIQFSTPGGTRVIWELNTGVAR
ncbi:MAG: hypothetical protein WAM82_01415 [Thermoanaerobaculia bacterium]